MTRVCCPDLFLLLIVSSISLTFNFFYSMTLYVSFMLFMSVFLRAYGGTTRAVMLAMVDGFLAGLAATTFSYSTDAAPAAAYDGLSSAAFCPFPLRFDCVSFTNGASS